jgi:NADH:ubiquinone reductase (H+-translocating)
MSENTAVVVLGGGYAGVRAANTLARRTDLTVTLVNPRPDFVERIRLHQLVGGSDDAVVDFRDVLAGRIRLVVDTATRIDAERRTVTLAGGPPLRYDYLVYAVGSAGAALTVPGAAEHAHPIAVLEDAQALRPALAAAPADAPVTVVGAGPTGIETAAELAEQGRAVTLVCGRELGPYLHPRGRRAVTRTLTGLGVTVLAGCTVTAVGADSVTLDDGRELPSAVTIWAAGFGVPDLAARSGLTVDPVGRLHTDPTLSSVDDPRIIGAGDSAAADHPVRMSCQAAGQTGLRAAQTVLARIDGATPKPAKVFFAGQCLSLGRKLGFFQVAHLDDAPRGVHLAGKPAARLKELVCDQTVQSLRRGAAKSPDGAPAEPGVAA